MQNNVTGFMCMIKEGKQMLNFMCMIKEGKQMLKTQF